MFLFVTYGLSCLCCMSSLLLIILFSVLLACYYHLGVHSVLMCPTLTVSICIVLIHVLSHTLIGYATLHCCQYFCMHTCLYHAAAVNPWVLLIYLIGSLVCMCMVSLSITTTLIYWGSIVFFWYVSTTRWLVRFAHTTVFSCLCCIPHTCVCTAMYNCPMLPMSVYGSPLCMIAALIWPVS